MAGEIATRRKLTTDRPGVTVKVNHGATEGYVTVNFYDNQQPGEVFITIAKQGSFLQSAFDMLAMQASFLLQHGVPAAWLFGDGGKWRAQRVEPFVQSPDGSGTLSLYDSIANAVMRACSVFGAQPQHGYEGQPPDPRPAADLLQKAESHLAAINERTEPKEGAG